MSAAIRYWRWRDNPNEPATWGPEVRLVVCAEGLYEPARALEAAEARDAFLRYVRSDRPVVVPFTDPPSFAFRAGIIPAPPIIRTQADLDGRMCEACSGEGDVTVYRGDDCSGCIDFERCTACHTTGTIGGIRALLAVRAERRSLVCSPREAIDLRLRACRSCGEPVPEHPAKRFCARADRGVSFCRAATPIDLVIILGETGHDERPMHPDHVRKLVGQCKAAGVPVVLKWGDWVPGGHLPGGFEDRWIEDDAEAYLPETNAWVKWYRVGPDRSGSMLDGAEVCDLPEWVTAS